MVKKFFPRKFGPLAIQGAETARNLVRRVFLGKPEFEYFLGDRQAFRKIRREALSLGGAAEIVKPKTARDSGWVARMAPAGKTILCRVKGLSGEKELQLRKKFKLSLAPLRTSEEKLRQAPKGISIEPASQEDLDELHEVERKSFSPEFQAPIEELGTRLRDGMVFKAVHERTGRIVGMLFTSPKRFEGLKRLMDSTVARTRGGSVFSPHHHIIDLAVLPEFRRSNVGGALMNYGLAQAKERRATKVFLHAVTPENFRFFEQMGFLLHEPTFSAEEEKRKAGKPTSGSRIYWMPLATGETEKHYKRLHEEMQKNLQAMATAENENTGKRLGVLAGWLEPHLPERIRNDPTEKARTIARFLARELISTSSIKELEGLPLFKSDRPLNTSRIQWQLENRIRKQFELDELSETEWHRHESRARLGK